MSIPRGDLRDHTIIIRMVARRTYSQEPWPFEQMRLAELFDLAVAAERLAEPYHRMRDLVTRGELEQPVLERIDRELGPVDQAPDADEIEWARALLDELEGRRSDVSADTAADLRAACSRVRRLIQLADEPGGQ
jgi:hypothetical protein